MDNSGNNRQAALKHFSQARRKAQREQLSAILSGRDTRLLSFEEIRAELRLQNPQYRGIQQIELDQVVGSLGRYREFTRHFLPLNDSLLERWVGVEALAMTRGWPPIETYKIGDVYFVKDGNHRMGVARQMGNNTIEAHVWEFPADISFNTAADLDQILIDLGEQRFLTETGLNEITPDHNIQFTIPGQYNELSAQIEDMRRKLQIIDQQEASEIADRDVVLAWYDLAYLPTIQIIHDANLLAEFPGRTEADLFVWLSHHRDRLGDQYGEFENLADLATNLAEQYRESNLQKATRQVRNLFGSNKLPPLLEEDLENDDN